MFKEIEIKLTGPICDCAEQNISWHIINGPGLGLKCKTCETELRVPNSKFMARFNLDKPYPGKKDEPKKKPELKSLDGGKVLEFKPNSDKEPA